MLSQKKTPRDVNSVQQPRLTNLQQTRKEKGANASEEAGAAGADASPSEGERRRGTSPEPRETNATNASVGMHRRRASLPDAAETAVAMNAMSFANLLDAYAPTVQTDGKKEKKQTGTRATRRRRSDAFFRATRRATTSEKEVTKPKPRTRCVRSRTRTALSRPTAPSPTSTGASTAAARRSATRSASCRATSPRSRGGVRGDAHAGVGGDAGRGERDDPRMTNARG